MKKTFLFSLLFTKGDQFVFKKLKEIIIIYFNRKDDTHLIIL